MTKSNQGADSIGVHPSAVGLSQYAWGLNNVTAKETIEIIIGNYCN